MRMQKVSLTEFRSAAVLVGPTTVVGLLIANASVSVSPPLSTQLWWQICMAVFSFLTILGVVLFVMPQLQGLRFRTPWYRKTNVASSAAKAELTTEVQELVGYGHSLKHAVPLIRIYREVRSITDRLIEFSNSAAKDRDEKSSTGQTPTQDMTRRWAINAGIYDANLRQDVNKIAAKLKSDYGIVPGPLMEVALAQPVFGNDVDVKIRAFRAICKDLAESLADDLATLSV